VTNCPDGFTCLAGSCQPTRVLPEELPSFDSSLVLGGMDDLTPAECFDTVPCMAGGMLVSPDDECTVARPDGDDINVALRVVHDGLCDSMNRMCFVPLDMGSDEGVTLEGSRLKLPIAVCAKLRQGLVRGVYVSTACASKRASNPPCAPSSAVSYDHAIMPARVTVPVTADELKQLPMSNGQRQPCCTLTSDGNMLYACACDRDDKTSAELFQVTMHSGLVGSLGTLRANRGKPFFAAEAFKGSLYWVVDRQVRKTSLTQGAATMSFPVSAGLSPYENASVLVDDSAVYAVAGDDGGKIPFQVSVTDPSTGAAKATLPTGDGIGSIFQLDQDADSIYMVRNTDPPMESIVAGMSFTRGSRLIRVSKGMAQYTVVLPQKMVATSSTSHGGYLAVQVDGTKLYTLYEDSPRGDGSSVVQLLRIDLGNPMASAMPEMLWSMTINPKVTTLVLQGVVEDVAVLLRSDSVTTSSGTTGIWSFISIGPTAQRIVADFNEPAPVPGLAFDDTKLYWLNQTGTIYSFSKSALQ
jgi:hypothetical protein